MPIDPFYEPMTVKGQLRRKAIKVWPSIYNFINHMFFTILDSLKAMLVSVYNSIKP